MFEYPDTIATTLPCDIPPPPAVNAKDAVATVIELVWLFSTNDDVWLLVTTLLVFNNKEPVIVTDPDRLIFLN